MSKHTPGPWIAVGGWVEHPDDKVADICVCNPAEFNQEHLKRSETEQFAKARLIAAAPKMFEVLQLMHLHLTNPVALQMTRAQLIQKARNAIIKVTGEEE